MGFRIVTRRPDSLEWLIIQNTNAYEVGFTAVWDGLRGAYWKSRTPETEKPLEAFLQADTVKLVYTHGHRRPELISPDNWNMDLHYLDRPNARQNVAFARGAHSCPGGPLARIEGRVTIARILDRLREIRLDESYHGPPGNRRFDYVPLWIVRGLSELHIDFSARS